MNSTAWLLLGMVGVGHYAKGEPPASVVSWAEWRVHDAAPGEFSLVHSARFERSAPTDTDPYISRPIPYGKRHFTLKIRYRTDGRLSPTVLIFLPPAVDVRPLAIFRLPPSIEWTEYTTDFVGHDAKQPALELRIYPGTMGSEVMRPGGLIPNGAEAGRVEIGELAWTLTDDPVAELTAGPQQFSTEIITYKHIGDLELKVHIDRPENPVSNVAVIWFHGGGFIGGTPDNCLLQATFLASRGIICVRPAYRLEQQGGNADLTLQDAADAVEWVRQHGSDYGIDPQRFVLAGTSAGAVLGAVMSQQADECLGFVGLAGYYDMVHPWDSAAIKQAAPFFNGGKDPGMWTRISAIHQIRAEPTPAFLIHGLLDSTIDCRQTTAYARALQLAGGKTEVVILPWLNHVPNLVADDVFTQVESFIRELQTTARK